MSKVKKSTGSATIIAPGDPAFSQAAQHADGVGWAANALYSVGEAGMACGDAVVVISNSDDACCAEKKTPTNQLLHDLKVLKAMQLRAKYQGEANSHRNMLSREKSKSAVVHHSFRSFSDFLFHVGPKPTKSATLDRIDNTDPEYAPGKVRWADKQTQNRNKGDSLVFTCPTSSRSYTAGQLAKKQGVTAAAIRSRRARGWTDAEIIVGEKQSGEASKASARVVLPKPHARSLSGSEILFRKRREYCEQHRAEHGVEYFITTPSELQAKLVSDFPAYRGEEWLKRTGERFLRNKLLKWWEQYKPHISFADLRPDQQAWVRLIDPTQRQKMELADCL